MISARRLGNAARFADPVRYPYIRGVLLRMYREAKHRIGDPVIEWPEIQADPVRRREYQQARGKGILVRANWDEVVEFIAAWCHRLCAR